jgi:hypothetical protein
VGLKKVFNEADSRCCNIIKIVEIYIFFFDRLGGLCPEVTIYIYIADEYNLQKIFRLGAKHLAK